MNYYLCGPVDFAGGDKSWKQALKELCKNHRDILLFDPDTYTFNVINERISNYIYNVNMGAIDYADALIARWMHGQVAVGTPIELFYAIQHEKAIILITDMAETSVYLNYIASRCHFVTPNLNEVYGELLKLENQYDILPVKPGDVR